MRVAKSEASCFDASPSTSGADAPAGVAPRRRVNWGGAIWSLLALGALLLCCQTCDAAKLLQTNETQIYKGTLLRHSAEYEDHGDIDSITLETDNGFYQLNASPRLFQEMMSLMTGTQLSVTGTMSPSRARIAVDSYSIIEDAFPTRRLQAMSATAPPVRSDISAIIFLISPCGYPAAANKADVENLLFGGSYNLDGYIRQCSANKAVLSRSSVVVGPVQMPCNGVDNRGRSWGGDGLCGWAELNGWQDWTANYASETLGLDMRTFKHRVLVVPTGLCSFVGQALLGARERDEYGDYGWSQVWLGGNYADKPQNYFHEIGHNYYLSHASTLENVEYGDYSCAMGYCCAVRCFNAPHSWQMGWAKPILSLTPDKLGPGATSRATLPGQTASSNSLVVVQPSSCNDNLFVSYRPVKAPYDNQIHGWLGAVMLHRYSAQHWADMTRTYVLGRAVPGSPVTVSLCGAEMTITVRVRSMDATSADVTVCRTSQAGRESSCSDGLDNDCDGWTDQDDPDCGGGGRPPAPVASPPPIALVLRSPPPSPPPRRPPPPWLSPPPPPSPSPPPAFPSSSEMTVSEMYFSDSNNVYELFRAPLGYQQAIDFCAGRGATTGLSLYRTDEDRAAIDKLCAGISCWLAKPIPSEACPVLTAGKFKTDCPSSYSFVCKRSFEETVVPTPAPIPSPSPVPAPPAPIVVTGDVVITDSAVFRLYRSPTSYAMAVEACAANGGGATMAVYRFAEDKAAMDTLCSGITCWLAKPNPDSACPAVSIPEGKFKSDCGGVYAYVCRLPPISSDAPTPDVAPVPAGDSRVIKGMLFELMRVEATYQQAKDVCASRGAGSTMAVYRYASDKAAMKRLCESLTCWLAKPKPDKTCPTVSDRGFRSDCAGSYAYVCKRPAPGVKAMGTAPGPADGPEYSAGDSPVTSQPEAEQDYEDYDVPQPPAGDDDVAVGAVDTSDYGDSSAADSSAVQSAAAGATSGP